ncbi:MAG: thiamine-phosphate kinase [Alphaproteobacteria bacterium]|nr:thiamine-phosphate kinase [Alphaproteobacteria bacterium]
MANEHTLIRKYFAPLAEAFPGSLNLTDDAAILDIPAGQQLVVTKDAISEGIHYLAGTDPAMIAKKLLRTNLSDLAAMGATPYCYFLAMALPSPLSEDFIRRFAEGLAEDQKEFGISLAGGDTIATNGAPVFSLTAHGLVPQGAALRRNGAQTGDAIYVSGTLGDAALGLHRYQVTGGRWQEDDYLMQRYLLPQPRLELGVQLRGQAMSCIDISDGLLADMGHICDASNVGAEISLEHIPLSDAAKKMLEASPELWPLIYSGGDDYELLFTLPEGEKPPAGTTKIGKIIAGSGVKLLHEGKEVPVQKKGYSH